MMIFVAIIQVIVSLFLILVVLLQQGKSADWSGTFGGGSSQTAFGQRGSATLLSKATTVAAILFMVSSLTLTILTSRPGSRSVVPANVTTPASAPAATTPPATSTPAPATPETTPATKEAAPAAPAGKDAAPAAPTTEKSK
jgi:preprotein translocase subunit SecG